MDFVSATGFAFPSLAKQELTRGEVRTAEIVSNDQIQKPIKTTDLEVKLNDPVSFLNHYPHLKDTNTTSPSSSLTFLNSSESDDESKRVDESDSDVESDEISISPQELHHLNKLQLDHQFLAEQNRVLMKELACAKMTAQALRSIILQKDEQLSQLAKDLPNLNLTALNSIKLTAPNNESGKPTENGGVEEGAKLNRVPTATATGKRKEESRLGSKMKLSLRLLGLSSKS